MPLTQNIDMSNSISFNDAEEKNNAGLTKHPNFLVVGIGASAGGIQALKKFFEQVPADSGMAFVVILHLSPDHDSQLGAVLQTSAKIPVRQVADKVSLEADQVYVISPGRHLVIEDGHLLATRNVRLEERRAPVDIFFRTLAETQGERAVGVVLSGTGANGSMGLRRVKECGGAIFVQDPKEAEFNEMPVHCIQTALVDEVLPVGGIPGKIIQYKTNLDTARRLPDSGPREGEEQDALQEVLTQLRLRTGHDFVNYKRPTLLRRIERRLYIRNQPDLPAYASFLQEHPEETVSLLKDLLISVTHFFRDTKAFEVLREEVIPSILRGKTSEHQVRIWVAGCATGEEAYSMAMLFAERTMRLADAPRVQVFATDIDDYAITRAREGFYTLNDAADVPPERLENFFLKDGEGYRIRREIREMVMFANHNFLKDPPFSRIDMISCRNVLIYLNQTGQNRVLETFHFALNPGGFLFLGSSESPDGPSELYAPFNREEHIFRRREALVRRSYPLPEITSHFTVGAVPPLTPVLQPESRAQERINLGDLHRQLLEEYAPPSIVVNEDFDILHLSENAGRYLQIAGGELSGNLVRLIRPELRLDLQAALYQAVHLKAPVETRTLEVAIEEKTEAINIILRPALHAGDIAKGLILVLFRQATPPGGEKQAIHTPDEPAGHRLEEELVYMTAQLHISNEQHRFHSEELTASNEELQAMNEELRSAAEELETSKEELQSINEELRAVNQEMKVKIEEVGMSNNNLQNLINSAEVGTIFLDRAFRISLFTPSARDVFNLIPGDHGRPLSDITHKLQYKDLIEDAESVLQTLRIIEREVRTTDGRTFMMRVLPYRTIEDKISGVVLTFFNISEQKKIEEAKLLLAAVVESSEDSIVTVNFQGVITSWNKAAEKLYGYSAPDAVGRPLTILTLPEDLKDLREKIDAIKLSQIVEIYDTVRVKRDGEYVNLEIVLSPVRDSGGNPIGVSTIARDITARRRAEARLRETRQSLDIALDAARMGVWNVNFIRKTTQTDIRHNRLFGYTEAVSEWSPEILRGHILREDRENYDRGYANALETGVLDLQFRVLWSDESIHWLHELGRISYNELRQPLNMTGITLDITERKQIEEAVVISEERNRIALQSAGMGAWDWNIEEDKVSWNEQHYLILGLGPDLIQKSPAFFLQFVHPEDLAAVSRELDKAVAEGSVFHCEFRIIRADGGEVRWMNGYGRIVAKENGRSRHMIGVIYDITHRKMLEQQKDEFISIASHELKTPVTSIKAYAQILKRMFEEDREPEKGELLRKMDIQVDRLMNLIRTLLDNTKIFEGQLPLHLEPFDLNVLMAERLEDLKFLSAQHQLRFRAEKAFTITADRERIGEVITNLVSNAIKYSPHGGDVTIECIAVPEGVRVSVTDQGIGIPEDLRKKVFGRFFRGSYSQNLTIPGLGLGLYIAAGIIHRHHGTINVDSELGKGSVFYFILPL